MTKPNKTRPTKQDARSFIENIDNPTRREDAKAVLELMSRLTGEVPVLWGPSIVGFGSYHYRYDSGREGDYFLTGFSPRKANLVIYVMPGFEPFADLMGRLGRFKTGRSCLYVNKLADLDVAVLEKLLDASVKLVKERYGA